MADVSKRGAFALLAVATTTIMVGCVIVPGLPAIAAHLGVAGAAGWLVTVPSLGVIVFAPVAARLIDRMGNRRALCAGLIGYGLFGAAGMLLHGPFTVFADRLLLGGATAVVMAAGTGLISDFYDGGERLAMIARQGMAIELGGVVFLFAGGLLASAGWRLPFLLYLVAWVLLVMVWRWVPAPAAPTLPEPAGRRLPAALAWICTTAVLAMILFFTAVIVLPTRLREVGFNAAQTGYFLSFVSLVAVLAAACMPKLVQRVGESSVLALAFVCFGIGHGCFASATAFPLLAAGAVALGTGFGLSVPLVNGMTVDRTPPAQRARALARLSMAIFGGQFLSSFMEMAGGTPATVFGIAGGVAVAGAAAIVVLRKRFIVSAAVP